MKLVMNGDGPERKGLQNRNPHVVFAGARIGEDLATHFAFADVFLFPSITETFGNVMLEAMASGLEVIAYDYAAALAPDPARIVSMRTRARAVAGQIDWEKVFSDFEAVLVDVMRRQESAHG